MQTVTLLTFANTFTVTLSATQYQLFSCHREKERGLSQTLGLLEREGVAVPAGDSVSEVSVLCMTWLSMRAH